MGAFEQGITNLAGSITDAWADVKVARDHGEWQAELAATAVMDTYLDTLAAVIGQQAAR